jgi:hypothetical protein
MKKFYKANISFHTSKHLKWFDEVFSGYQQRQISVWNRRFEEHLGHYQIPNDDDYDDRDGPRNVGFIQTSDAADSLRRLHRIQSPRKLKIMNLNWYFVNYDIEFSEVLC